MRTTSTFSVYFWVKPKNAKINKGIIYARITVNQKRVLVSLKREISLELWDFQNRRARGNTAQAKHINLHLDSAKSRIFQCYHELTSRDKKVTAKIIKVTYLGEDENSKSLLNLIDYHSKKIFGAVYCQSIMADLSL